MNSAEQSTTFACKTMELPGKIMINAILQKLSSDQSTFPSSILAAEVSGHEAMAARTRAMLRAAIHPDPAIIVARRARCAAEQSLLLDAMAKSETVNYLAYYDVLTALPNRTLLLDRVRQYLTDTPASKQGAALLMLDIQRFGNVNDTLGRIDGDEILKTVAARLTDSVGAQATPARIGSDLFALFATGVSDERDAMVLAQKTLHACFGKPFVVNGSALHLAGRIGIALPPIGAADADGWYRTAEIAHARARKDDEECLFYSPHMSARIAGQFDLENRLRRAVDERQFILHYQPKISSRTGELTSVEALIRWNDPEHGLIQPECFIPLLEETGLILAVGEWALREAARQYAAWRSLGLKAPRIAVNVSLKQLQSAAFLPLLHDVLAHSPDGDHGIDLELTESLAMTQVDDNIVKLAAARRMGMRVSIDDFGTGYSSLRYIARLPLDAVKVDRSFITDMAHNPHDLAIVRAVIALARSLDLKVIAEGVDCEEQARLLRLIRCDEMQGYLFARPMPPEQLAQLLSASCTDLPTDRTMKHA